MKTRLPGYILLFPLLCTAPGMLHASNMLTGNMITVNPYGAQDTARNPALLSSQEQNNSIGLTGRYTRPVYSDIDIKEFKTSLTKIDINTFNGGAARLSYARTIERFTLGFDYYFNIETDTIRQKLFNNRGVLVLGQGTSKDLNMTNLFTTALSVALTPTQAIGIRLNGSYINNKKTDNARFIQVSVPPVYVHTHEKTDFEQISMLPAVGYFGKFGTSEIGVMITTGRISWRKTDKRGTKYDVSSVLAQPLFKAQGAIPFKYNYTTGPSMLAGFHVRPSYDIGAGLEVEVLFPAAYRESFLIAGDTLTSLIPIGLLRLNYIPSSSLGLKNRIALKPSVSVRGGFEFNVSRNVVFNLGAGFGYNAPPTSNSGIYPAPLDISFTDYKIISVLGTAGFDFLVGKNSTVTLGTMITYYHSSQTQSIKHTLNILSPEVTSSIVTMDLVAAASIGF